LREARRAQARLTMEREAQICCLSHALGRTTTRRTYHAKDAMRSVIVRFGRGS